MEYKTLGNTNLVVSPICFGTLTVGPVQGNLSVPDGGEILAFGIEQGINFFDTAQLYQTYPYIKYAMNRANSYDIVVSSKTYAYTREMAIAAVEQARMELDRDYIDIFMLHEQESVHTLNGHAPALEYFYECKQKGIIKAVGASMHTISAVYGAIEKELDIIHPLINLNGLGISDGSREDMEQAIIHAHNKGIGIFSMKALGGGNLHKNASECLDYIFTRDFIDSVAIGMQSIDEVSANINFVNNHTFTEKDTIALHNKNRHLHIDDWCVGCGACVKRCKQNALYVEASIAKCTYDKCILCGYCSTVCKEWAIKVV